MKIHDFGLWFRDFVDLWSTTIPPKGWFYIYYDGEQLGFQDNYFNPPFPIGQRYTIKLTKPFSVIRDDGYSLARYDLGHRLTMDDFEIVKNPHYRDPL
jgi:hypothetical protein